jgi:hypothetical protein
MENAMSNGADDQYSPKETEQRLRAILRGAMHKPTPLKNIPKKRGGSRSLPKRNGQNGHHKP